MKTDKNGWNGCFLGLFVLYYISKAVHGNFDATVHAYVTSGAIFTTLTKDDDNL